MSDAETKPRAEGIDLDYHLDAPPGQVWRAITLPEFRDRWLGAALADPEATSVTPGEAVSYRMRESTPPFLESEVTFRIAPTETGGTHLRIRHDLVPRRGPLMAANDPRAPRRAA